MFQSAFGSIVGGNQNPLGFKRVDSAVAVVIDGLGLHQLAAFAGHARNLWRWSQASGGKSIRCGFPSTTAVSLASFGTGLKAGLHGVLGYQVLDSDNKPKNMLNGWRSNSEAILWRGGETIASRTGVKVHMVAHSEYEGSAFTDLIMAGASFEGRDDLGARVRKAADCAKARGALVYLYFAELDQAGHRFGVGSSQWISALEGIDAALEELKGKFGVVITSDHGMVNVDSSRHLFLDEVPGFRDAVNHAIGDPRALLCWGDFEVAKTTLA